MCYEMYKADYCLKHFKLVLYLEDVRFHCGGEAAVVSKKKSFKTMKLHQNYVIKIYEKSRIFCLNHKFIAADDSSYDETQCPAKM